MKGTRIEARERISLIFKIVYGENLRKFSEALKMSPRKVSDYVGDNAETPDILFMINLLSTHRFIDKDWILTGIPNQLKKIEEKKLLENNYTDMIIDKLDSMSSELKSIRDILVLFSSRKW